MPLSVRSPGWRANRRVLRGIVLCVGLALIGHRVGQPIRWQGPDRVAHRATLAEILYQPEAAQDFGT